MAGLLPSSLPFLDDSHRFALGARQRARCHQRQLHREPDRLGQPLADPAAQVDEDGVRGVEAAAALARNGRLDGRRPAMSDEREMMARIERGERLESADEMTPVYRDHLVHLMTMQADSELAGG